MKGKLAICSIVLLSALFVVGIAYACAPDKVAICHATNGEYPFNSIEVSRNAIVGGHGGHGGDIISVFTYVVNEQVGTEHRHKTDKKWGPWSSGSCYGFVQCQERPVMGDVTYTYLGQNLATLYNGFTGAQVLANGCVVPRQSQSHEVVISVYTNCREASAMMYVDGNGEQRGPTAFTDPYAIESHSWAFTPPAEIPGDTYHYYWLGGEVGRNDMPWSGAIPEPTECLISEPIPDCTDAEALNYNADATVDDGTCEYFIPEPIPEPPTFCTYTVTTYFQCNTGTAIWVQETGITSGEGTNFVGYAPYNRECGFCDGITGIYHREWRNTCDGSGWDEGSWNLPEWMHELNGCPLGGRCIGD